MLSFNRIWNFSSFFEVPLKLVIHLKTHTESPRTMFLYQTLRLRVQFHTRARNANGPAIKQIARVASTDNVITDDKTQFFTPKAVTRNLEAFWEVALCN